MTGMLALALGAAPAMAQSGDGYLFGRPQGSVTIRGGFSQASAKGDLFDELMSDFTLKRGDFSGFAAGFEGAVRVSDHVDLTADVGFTTRTTPSSYRDFVDNNNREIEQSTTFRRVPATLNAKLYLGTRGRSIGRFAWIPNGLVPWVGIGGGVMGYSLKQEGDFIDATTNNVRSDSYVSEGYTPMAQGMAGLDITISPRLALTGDARYLLAKSAPLSSAFQGYQPLDLSGAVLSLGLTVRL